MKTMKLMMMVLSIMFVSSCATAQSQIDRIVDELEQKGVDISKVVKRDPKTKQVYSIVKSFSFYSKDSKYANRLKEAFKKEAENAVTETTSNYGNDYVLIFQDGKKKSTYSLSIKNRKDEDPLVQLSIVFRNYSVKSDDGFILNYNWDGLKSLESLDSLHVSWDSSTIPLDIIKKFRTDSKKKKRLGAIIRNKN